jgi:uncharacterized protein YqhQ
MQEKLTIGGQAVIEGVMMRTDDKYAICIRRPDKKISTKIVDIKKNKSKIASLPVIRGIIRFVETLQIGVKSISYSASESVGEEEKLSSWDLFLTLVFSIGMTILLFYAAPFFVAKLLTENKGILFNLLDGILRLIIFLSYLLIISLMPDIRRIFQYHGAEHMAVHCFEHGEKLTVKNVRKYTTLHPRCGTNFILIVFIVSLLFFSFLPVEGYLLKLAARILFLPLIAGISYEFLKLAGKYHEKSSLVRLLDYPGLLLQKITTRRPEDGMIEVAIKALAAVKKASKS